MSDRVVMGVDPSTKNVAVAYMDSGSLVTTNLSLGKDRYGPKTSWRAYRSVVTLLESVTPGVVFVEAPLVGRGGVRTTMVQSMVSGAIQTAFVEMGWDVYLCHQSKWKKEVIGAGNSTKADIREHILKLYPQVTSLEGESQDVIDAVGIMEYGHIVVLRSESIMKEAQA